MMYLSITIAILLLMIVGFGLLINLELKKTIYAYKNIILFAGLIGSTVLLGMIIEFWITNQDDNLLDGLLNLFFIQFPEILSIISIPISVIIFGLISISNIFLIKNEGFRIKNLLGFMFGIVYIGLAVGAYIFLDNANNAEVSPIITSVEIFILFILCYMEWIYFAYLIVNYIAIKHIPSYDKDYIVILGCLISRSGGLLPLLKQRTNRAIRYAWDQEIATGKPVKFVPAGGQGPNEVIAEGTAIEMYLLSHGAEDYEIYTEKKSKNTRENFVFAKKIIDESHEGDYRIAFATTNYHVFRSGIYARMAGFKNPEGIASKTKWYFWPNGMLREFVAVITMYKEIHIGFVLMDMLACMILYFVR